MNGIKIRLTLSTVQRDCLHQLMQIKINGPSVAEVNTDD